MLVSVSVVILMQYPFKPSLVITLHTFFYSLLSVNRIGKYFGSILSIFTCSFEFEFPFLFRLADTQSQSVYSVIKLLTSVRKDMRSSSPLASVWKWMSQTRFKVVFFRRAFLHAYNRNVIASLVEFMWSSRLFCHEVRCE